MLARIVFMQMKPGKKGEGSRLWDEELAPLLQKQKGFYRAFRMEEPDSSEGLVVELWESIEEEKMFLQSEERKELTRKFKDTIGELDMKPFELVKEVHHKNSKG